LGAAKRNPIPCEPGDAKHVEEVSLGVPPSGGPSRLNAELRTKNLVITNGWLTCDGKLLTGGLMDLTWWRGSIRPNEAPSFGPELTRFGPGRRGTGFTDDINELADLMQERGAVALDHHYGLWYERRRDDHERTRRINGDVLPPFFEQPFERSGQ